MNRLQRRLAFVGLLAFAGLVSVGPASAQLTPEQQAEMTLSSARKAFNEKNYPFAAARFREYLGKFGGHKEANDARFGLAVTLLEGPEKDRNYQEIQQLLAPLAKDGNFPEQASAAYRFADSFRVQGLTELAKADATANPGEAKQRRDVARERFTQAATAFTQALPIVQAKAKAKDAGDKELSEEWEWLARVHCDLGEMQLRVGRTKDAKSTTEPFLKDPHLSRSRYKDLGRYVYAHAAFLLGEMPVAQKTLTMIAPFSSVDFGPHARYLLARTHHVAEERGDALTQYERAIADHAKNIADAKKLLTEPQRFNNDPNKRAELEAFVKQPTPDFVGRANLYLGVLLYEADRFAEAKGRFQEFVKAFPDSPLKFDALLRIGFCQVQLKEYAEAIKTLQPVAEKEEHADQAFLWIGKAQIGLSPDAATKWQEFRAKGAEAINTLRGAFDRAVRLGDTPENRIRRGEILLEIADHMLAMKDSKDAAATYQKILNEKLLTDREEEVSLRLAQALHLANDFNEADARCQAFFQKYPKSTLSAAAAFTFAENAFFRAAALDKTPPSPDRTKQSAALYDEAIKRFEVVLKKYPEHPKVLLARYSVGLSNYRKGDFDKALAALREIPQPERAGELGLTPFLMADCVLRQTPTSLPADADALATGKVEEQLKSSAELLEGFISGNPKDANTPDALLKFGVCQHRRANLLSDPKIKQATLQIARSALERLKKDFPNHPLQPNATYERAKVILSQGDIGQGTNELRRFTQDPLRQSTIAPMAVVNLATLLRSQEKAAEAVELLRVTREQHEGRLGQDPALANWVGLLRFHHAAALREAGKRPEARALFDQVAKQFPKSDVGIEAALRFGQTLKEEGQARVEEGRKLLGKVKEAEQGKNMMNEGYKTIRDAVQYLETTADQMKSLETSREPRARMLYEAAWGTRIAGEPELEEAKRAVAKELIAKHSPAAAKLPMPEISLDRVPMQASEKKARGLYQNLIEQFADVPLAVEARFELAELYAQRNEFKPALELLSEALDLEPGVDLTERIRLRLGSIHGANGNTKGALAQFDAIAQNPKTKNLGWAQYRAAEVLLQDKNPADAIKRLTMFRDNGQYQNVAGLSDRALVRLGAAYATLGANGESYQAYERCVNAFSNSPWSDEARFGMAMAMQRQKNFDGAVNWYNQVVSRTATELAARAQYQIGQCRIEQKRWVDAANAFLVVPTTYNYPELSAASLYEAAQAYREANNREESVRLLERLVRDYPTTVFANEAKSQLEKK